MKSLFKNFRFSAKVSTICISLAVVMVWCSTWQWSRYKEKLILVETYRAHGDATPLKFPSQGTELSDFTGVLNQRVQLSGTYDYEHQMIVQNKKHASGPGYRLLTPLKLDDSTRYIIVSRGFIPFVDREPETWEKYTFESIETLDAVVKQSTKKKKFSPSNPEIIEGGPFERKWFYPEISKMAKQLPYPIIETVFVQRIGAPPKGEFPAQSIRIEVPPQTHFGYTIEWALLALLSLTVGLALQCFPKKKRLEREPGLVEANK